MTNVLTRKLQLFGELSAADRELLDEVVSSPSTVLSNQNLVREGDIPDHIHVILSGLACRNQVLANGTRQITALLLPGDFCDFQVLTLKTVDYNLSTLSPTVVVRVPKNKAFEILQRPNLARALSLAALVDGATLRAALVNIGTRNAETRIAHFFCELHMRMLAVGLVQAGMFNLPATQVDISDAVGMSAVHVNRIFQALRRKQLISVKGKKVSILDVKQLRQLAGFDPSYLHLEFNG